MKKKSNTLVFFGNGPVAAASLAYLAEHFEIELVVTKTRPLHHKDPAPVEEFANEHNLTLAFANNKNDLEELTIRSQPSSACGVVIDYGVIISQIVIDYFPLGILNSHFSILPEWRGADPITFSLLSGQTITGVSLMKIDVGLDTGDIIAEAPVEITPDETNQSLTAKLIDTSNAILSEVLPEYLAGSVVPIPQPPQSIATYSRKLIKQDASIDTDKPAGVLEREIRAFSEWPKSKFIINENLTIIVTRAKATSKQIIPGQIKITDDKKLLIGTRVGSLEIVELMPIGKQRMSATAFLNGYGTRII